MLERLLINIRLWFLTSSRIWIIPIGLIFFSLVSLPLFMFLPLKYALIGTAGIFATTVIIAFAPYLGIILFYVFSFCSPDELSGVPFPLAIIIMTAIAWVLKELNPKEMVKSFQTRSFFAFWLTIVISAIFAYKREYCLTPLLDFTQLFVFYIVTINLINSEKKFYSVVWAIVIIFALLSFKGMVSWAMDGITRIGGAGGDDDHFAVALCMALPFSLYILFTERNGFKQIAAIISFFLIICGIITTISRGGFMGLGIVLFLFFLKVKKPAFLFIYLFFFVFILLAGLLLIPKEYVERLHTIPHYQEDQSAMARIQFWHAGGKMMIERPITGVGIGNFKEIGYLYEPGIEGFVAHNAFIQVASECGILGFLAFVWLIISSMIRSFRLRERLKAAHGGKRLIPFTHMIEVSFPAYVVCASFCGSLLSELDFEFLYLLIAMGVCLENIAGQKVYSARA
ncbi:MAG: O-antigen ligase family protein [Candidatus Desantisbacteria bacterium]